jgi:iron complex transport system substrate-binding protein
MPFERVVCLTEETVEALYLLGQDHRIAGVTGYAVRPPQVRREKPRVGAFTSADCDKIAALKPDLVLTFSDLQADIAADLIRRGFSVHAFNQRKVAGILDMIQTLGRLFDCSDRADALVAGYHAKLNALVQSRPKRPLRIYFEEWDDPPISGIGWVSELIEIAGGQDVFAHLSKEQGAKSRILDPSAIIDAAPDVIIASWCGKKVVIDKIKRRAGWDAIPAVKNDLIFEIKSPLILQPGPAALTDGLDRLCDIMRHARRSLDEKEPAT